MKLVFFPIGPPISHAGMCNTDSHFLSWGRRDTFALSAQLLLHQIRFFCSVPATGENCDGSDTPCQRDRRERDKPDHGRLCTTCDRISNKHAALPRYTVLPFFLGSYVCHISMFTFETAEQHLGGYQILFFHFICCLAKIHTPPHFFSARPTHSPSSPGLGKHIHVLEVFCPPCPGFLGEMCAIDARVSMARLPSSLTYYVVRRSCDPNDSSRHPSKARVTFHTAHPISLRFLCIPSVSGKGSTW